MKQKYLKPTCISTEIPFPFIMGTVSTGTSSLPSGGNAESPASDISKPGGPSAPKAV